MSLLRADLVALTNLPATPAGRRVTVGTLLGLGLLALLWWSVAQTVVEHPQLLRLLHRNAHGDSLRALLGIGLMPCAVAASWLGLSLAQRQLFETPELLLWRTAPLPGWRAAVQVLLRASFLTLLWASALSLPFVGTVLARSPAGWLAWALVPIAVACCTVPLLAALLAVQIVLVRFFAGRVLRVVLALVAALASVAFSTWLLLGLFAPESTRLQMIAAVPGEAGRLPWTIESAAMLLAQAANGRLDVLALRASLGWLGLATALFWFAARLHPRAVEQHLESAPPLLRRRATRWPAGIAATMRRKELAQVLQQPGALVGFLVFAVLVFAIARERVLVAGMLADRRLPSDLVHVAAMASLWFLSVLLVLYAHMGRLVLWDGPQWSLYVASPAGAWAILRGKLTAVLLFLLWPLVLVATAGRQLFGASPQALAAFVGIALGGTLAALGVLATVGTSPRLMRPDDGGPVAQGGRSFLAALLLVTVFWLAIAPVLYVWVRIVGHVHTHDVGPAQVAAWMPRLVGGAVLYGSFVAAVGVAIGARNFRRLTAAQ